MIDYTLFIYGGGRTIFTLLRTSSTPSPVRASLSKESIPVGDSTHAEAVRETNGIGSAAGCACGGGSSDVAACEVLGDVAAGPVARLSCDCAHQQGIRRSDENAHGLFRF